MTAYKPHSRAQSALLSVITHEPATRQYHPGRHRPRDPRGEAGGCERGRGSHRGSGRNHYPPFVHRNEGARA
jgi:hypothetical protein